MKLRPDAVRSYFESRLQGQKFAHTAEVKARCPFHDDRIPSMSINLEKGVWKCHAGCGSGGLLDFEVKFSGCDLETAKANLAELLGDKQAFTFATKPEAVYQYHEANGRLVFEKLRYAGKRFVQRKPSGEKSWEYKLGDCKKPLYRLPEVLVANEIFICEGEKDADSVRALNLGNRDAGLFVAATTNFDGAGKWHDEYAPYFLGKKVVIFPDNDDPGRKHAEQVALSLYPHANGIKIVVLPGLSEKGDVSDFLKAHSATDLISEIKRAPRWQPLEDQQKLLVPVSALVSGFPEEVDWLVEGIVERGANGFISAVPKGGKSWAAVDLALSLALGCDWLGFRVPRPVPVALISREDNPSLTAWRIQHLYAAKSCPVPALIETNLYVNTRQQSAELMLDQPEQMQELLVAMRQVRPQFAIFDVFNVLHAKDENDNQEMRSVLRQFTRIQAEIGCGIAVVHHYNKNDQGSLTQRLRGSSAIAGWAEFLIGISMANEDSRTRRMEFECKAACPPEPIYFSIDSKNGGTRLQVVELPARVHRREGGEAASLMQ